MCTCMSRHRNMCMLDILRDTWDVMCTDRSLCTEQDFSVHYNPWTGWSMGFHYSTGFFSFHYYTGGYHGYWGPPRYRPPYYPPYRGGMYGGRGPVYIGGDVNINIDNSNNIYNRQNGVSTNDI